MIIFNTPFLQSVSAIVLNLRDDAANVFAGEKNLPGCPPASILFIMQCSEFSVVLQHFFHLGCDVQPIGAVFSAVSTINTVFDTLHSLTPFIGQVVLIWSPLEQIGHSCGKWNGNINRAGKAVAAASAESSCNSTVLLSLPHFFIRAEDFLSSMNSSALIPLNFISVQRCQTGVKCKSWAA